MHTERDRHDELDRQLQTLHDLGYPEIAGIDAAQLDDLVKPLHDRIPTTSRPAGPEAIPLLLVVTAALAPIADQVERWIVRGRRGWTDMRSELGNYHPIEGLELPPAPVYLLLDVDTGSETLNVTPNDALPHIRATGRTPLTIEEGVALVTHHANVFDTHNAFQALGSRATNKRIPSFWMSKGAPRLGWCWAGNPHTWLGSASAGQRLS